MFNLLGLSFNFSQEWSGLLASAFVLVSFLFSKQVITRLINLAGCVFFIVYGVCFIDSASTVIMNSALMIVHIYHLTRYLIDTYKKKHPNSTPAGDTVPPAFPEADDRANDEQTDFEKSKQPNEKS